MVFSFGTLAVEPLHIAHDLKLAAAWSAVRTAVDPVPELVRAFALICELRYARLQAFITHPQPNV